MDVAHFLIALGVLFLAGLVADQVGRLTRLPRVTMLLLIGILVGKGALGLIPQGVSDWFDTLSIIALTMVAFLLGGSLTGSNLAQHGRSILTISLAISVGTVLIVSGGLVLAGVDPGLAMVLGAIATATDPAAIADVIRQSRIHNGFSETLKGIVAIDDAWGLIAFSIVLVLVGQSDGVAGALHGVVWDLGGAALLGVVLGIPGAFLTGRLSPGEPLQAEAIGIVFLAAGLALQFEVSFLVAGMTAGAVISNLAAHHDRAFHEIEHIQWPFMILFFVLAGASLDFATLRLIGWAGGVFLLLRIIARLVCGSVGGILAGEPRRRANLFGLALLPQAGVAVGMALVAGDVLPEWATVIMAFTIASTVVFEIIGPPLTLLAIRAADKDSD